MPELGYIVQLVTRGHVVASNGVNVPVLNSFIYRMWGQPALPVGSAMANLLNSFRFGPWASISALLSTDYIADMFYCLFPNSPGRPPFVGITHASGGAAGTRLPLTQCVFARLDTGLRKRNYIGCKRFAPIVESQVVNDELTGAAQTSWQNACNLLKNTLTVKPGGVIYNFTPVVWSRELSALDLTIPPAIGADINKVVVDKTLGVWRHRREREALPVFHGARYQTSPGVTLLTGVPQDLTPVGTARFDSDGYGTTGNLVVPVGLAGYYRIVFHAQFASVPADSCMQAAIVTPTEGMMASFDFRTNANPPFIEVSLMSHMNAGDTFHFSATYFGAGGPVAVPLTFAEIELMGV